MLGRNITTYAITDFSVAQDDRLDLSAFGLYSANALALGVQSGANTVFTLPDGGVVTLSNVSLSTVSTFTPPACAAGLLAPCSA